MPFQTTQAFIYNPATDTTTAATGTYPGNGGHAGAVVLQDGRVFCVPFNATSAMIYGGGNGFNVNVSLSAYYNKY